MKKTNHKNWAKLGVSLVVASSLIACTVAEKSTSTDIKTWDATTLYQAGSYVAQGRSIFKATTAARGISPKDSQSDAMNPMGAWANSSYGDFKDQQRRLGVRSVGQTEPSLNDINAWTEGKTYHGNDLVSKSGKYYQSMWWNQDNNPDLDLYKNNYTSANGTLNWGPWVSLTEKQALEILKQQQGAITPPTDPDVTTPPVTTPPTNPDVTTPPVTTPPTDETLNSFLWSDKAIYLENDLAVIAGSPVRFFRSKWWNQDHTPTTPYANAWDSPWEEISEGRFVEILENGGATPPPVKPDPTPPTPPTDPTNPDVKPPITTNPGYEFVQQNGYIQEWSWEELPRELQEAFNKNSLNSSDIFASDGKTAVAMFTSKINAERWNLLFPRRIGSVEWKNNTGLNSDDYYSFDNFIDALNIVGDYAYLIQVALDASTLKETSFERNYVLHKPTRKVRLISQSGDYFASGNEWLLNRPHKLKTVDFAAFGAEGSNNDKARGIAGFLAHASHETSGSWSSAPGTPFDKSKFPGATFPDYITTELPGLLAWSLYFNEEVAYAGSTSSHYQDNNNKVFPPVAGQSYHGRGAFQLSWNYNYGLMSAMFFGTSKVLLENPNLIMTGGVIPTGWIKGQRISGGTLAFLTSVSFWLTPQGAKPSQQDTMILNRNDGRYIAGVAKLTEAPGLGEPGYGWTINIMNGGFEAGKSWVEGNAKYDSKVARRVKHYVFFTQSLGGNNEGEVLDTVKSHSY